MHCPVQELNRQLALLSTKLHRSSDFSRTQPCDYYSDYSYRLGYAAAQENTLTFYCQRSFVKKQQGFSKRVIAHFKAWGFERH